MTIAHYKEGAYLTGQWLFRYWRNCASYPASSDGKVRGNWPKNGGDRFVAEVVVRPRHKGHHPAFQKVHILAYFGSESYKLVRHFSTNNSINSLFSPQTSGLPGPATWKHPLWHHLWDIWKVLTISTVIWYFQKIAKLSHSKVWTWIWTYF